MTPDITSFCCGDGQVSIVSRRKHRSTRNAMVGRSGMGGARQDVRGFINNRYIQFPTSEIKLPQGVYPAS